jgi:hypothetical protein
MNRRFKFSLATLLLFMAFASVFLSHGTWALKLLSLRQDNARLRDEVGELSISDASKMHVTSVPTTTQDSWRWRVFVPHAARYRLGIAFNEIPAAGFLTPPIQDAVFDDELPSGELRLDAKLYRDGAGVWLLSVEVTAPNPADSGTITCPVKGPDLTWLDGTAFFSTKTGTTSNKIVDDNAPVALLRHRVVKHPSLPATFSKDDPSPGILIWLEPIDPR